MKAIIIDTETSSLDEKKGEVLQIAWQVTDGDFNTLSRKNHYLRMTRHPDASSMAVNGLDTGFLEANAGDPFFVYSLLLEDLRDADIVIGHFVQFDIRHIKADAVRRLSRGGSRALKKALDSKPRFDTKLDTALTSGIWMERRHPGPRLQELCGSLFLDTDDISFHSADGDVEAVRRCCAQMRKALPACIGELRERAERGPAPSPARRIRTVLSRPFRKEA